jgi:hypothetical protein
MHCVVQSLQKHARGAGLYGDHRRPSAYTYRDRRIQSAIDWRPLQVFVVNKERICPAQTNHMNHTTFGGYTRCVFFVFGGDVRKEDVWIPLWLAPVKRHNSISPNRTGWVVRLTLSRIVKKRKRKRSYNHPQPHSRGSCNTDSHTRLQGEDATARTARSNVTGKKKKKKGRGRSEGGNSTTGTCPWCRLYGDRYRLSTHVRRSGNRVDDRSAMLQVFVVSRKKKCATNGRQAASLRKHTHPMNWKTDAQNGRRGS